MKFADGQLQICIRQILPEDAPTSAWNGNILYIPPTGSTDVWWKLIRGVCSQLGFTTNQAALLLRYYSISKQRFLFYL
jgi:hypothetical protein